METTPNASPEPWLTAAEAARHLGYAIGTLYNKCSAREIPHRKVGRALRFKRSELDAWVEAQSAPVPPLVPRADEAA